MSPPAPSSLVIERNKLNELLHMKIESHTAGWRMSPPIPTSFVMESKGSRRFVASLG